MHTMYNSVLHSYSFYGFKGENNFMSCIIYIVSPESIAPWVSDQFVLTVHNWGDPCSNLIQAKIIHCLASCRPSLAFLSTKVVQNNINVI